MSILFTCRGELIKALQRDIFEIIRHDSIQIKCNKFLNFIFSKSVIYLMRKPTLNYGF